MFRLLRDWPELYDSIEPGANVRDIRSMERGFGINFPAELREFFTLQQGQSQDSSSGLFYQWHLLDFRGIYSYWQQLGQIPEIAADLLECHGPVRQLTCHRNWIPIATDYAGGLLCVDLAPGLGGRRGQLMEVGLDYPIRRVLAPAITDFLEKLISDFDQQLWRPTEWLWEPLVLNLNLNEASNTLAQFGLQLEMRSENQLRLKGWNRSCRWDEQSFLEVRYGQSQLQPVEGRWADRKTLILEFNTPLPSDANARLGFSRRT